MRIPVLKSPPPRAAKDLSLNPKKGLCKKKLKQEFTFFLLKTYN